VFYGFSQFSILPVDVAHAGYGRVRVRVDLYRLLVEDVGLVNHAESMMQIALQLESFLISLIKHQDPLADLHAAFIAAHFQIQSGHVYPTGNVFFVERNGLIEIVVGLLILVQLAVHNAQLSMNHAQDLG
jgi:hypothetical protein